MDFEQLASELIRALRGRRSQLAFSRRLGFSTNVVHTWEARRRWPTASRSLAVAERAGVDLEAALARFYGTVPAWVTSTPLTSPELVTRLLEDLRGRTNIGDVARRTGRSRFAVARWLKGDAEPRLPDFLRLIEAMSLRVLDFVAALVEPRLLPSFAGLWEKLESGRRAAFELPWSHAVLRVVELESYRREPHRPGFVAEQLGISLAEENECLGALLTSGQLDWDGTRYRAGAQLTDTRRHPEAGRVLKLFWARQALARLERESPGLFSYNLFSVSERDYERLRELHLAYFRELRRIVAESEPAERVVLAQLTLMPLTAGPGSGAVGG